MHAPSSHLTARLWPVYIALALCLTGCPPSGDAPPFTPPPEPDAEALPEDARTPDAEAPPRAECVDQDGDDYVQADDCGEGLQGGDCAPFDPQRHPGRAEMCDNIDNDCDEGIDEDFSLGEACEVDSLLGACRAGAWICRGGDGVCEPTNRNGDDEVCNGIDDDCDGTIDEEFPTAGEVCPTGFDGVCGSGTLQCRMVGDGSFEVQCVADIEPDEERPEVLCDGEDEDCDGVVDEGNPEGGEPCQTDLMGLCLDGTLTCGAEGLGCTPDINPGDRPELCNTFDDDCDGNTDEDFELLGAPCVEGEGACAQEGVYVCNPDGEGPAVVCNALAGEPGAAELCDGFDNDCDGNTDEGFADLGTPCEVGVGACVRAGVRVCAPEGEGTVCGAESGQPAVEQCNAVDDDCDGDTDETFVELGLGGPCIDESGQCPSPGTFVCADDEAGLRCEAEPVSPAPETCDNTDEDCDGSVDEDFAELGEACEVGVGACRNAGVFLCAPDGGGTLCSVEPSPPTEELCDELDNDCDGLIDDGATCPDPLTVQITLLSIAATDDARCADLSGGGGPDNALGAVAELFNQALALSVANNQRVAMLRAPALSVEQPFPLEILEGRRGEGALEVLSEGLDATGRSRQRIPAVALQGRELATSAAAARLTLVSPFFYDLAPALAQWRTVELMEARLNGPLAEGGELELRLVEAALTGILDREAVLARYSDASGTCAAMAPEDRPEGCEIFELVSYEALESALVADLDRDGDGEPESVSACLLLQTVPLADEQVEMPQLGGQPCDQDEVCRAGLICRPVVYTDEPALGASIERRCGLAGEGGFEEGAPCLEDANCRSGLCEALTRGGRRCIDLCAGDDECELGAACLGVHLDTPGAIGLGGATGRVCIPAEGSGQACVIGDSCPGDEICALWFDGDVGVAGGDVSLTGRCQLPIPGDRPVGSACGADHECANGYACVEDGSGGRSCLAPCAGIGQCPEGQLCLEGHPIAGLRASVASYGYCTPITPAVGSGAPCEVDRHCAGGETCLSYYLDITGEVQRYCAAGVGLFSVGQGCATHEDCASGRCVEGLCSGLCADNEDCGTRLGCRPDGTVEPESGVILGGACEPADQACARDADCNFGGDPVCAGGRCVCDTGRCRIGCRYPGICPAGLICQPDDTCVAFCKDDLEEPNEIQPLATPLELGRGRASVLQRRRMCAASGVDWYRFNNAGQPFRVRVGPEAGDAQVVMSLSVVDALGEAIPGVPSEEDGSLYFVFDDVEAAQAWVAEQIYIEVRAGGVIDAFDYELEVELLFPDCPDNEDPPMDEYWQFTPMLHTPDVLLETVDTWLCPQDEDWYGIRLYDGDELTLDLELVEDAEGQTAAIGLEVIGPDWPDLPEVNVFDIADDDVEILGTIATDAGGGQLTITPPSQTCDLEANQCTGEGGLTLKSCADDDDCRGSSVFVRVVGSNGFTHGQYRLRAGVQRPVPPACPEDLYEPSSFIGGYPAIRSIAAVDAVARTVLFGIPTLAFNQEVALKHLTLCSGDADAFVILAEPGDRLTAQVVQTGGQPQPVTVQFMVFDFNNATLDIYDTFTAAQGTINRSVVVEGDSTLFHAVQVQREEAPGLVRYDLSVRREPAGQLPDEGCDAPTRVELSPLTNTAVVEGTTTGARDDHVPLSCIGGAGPDRAYVISVPGPGTVEATVDAIGDDGYDPSVYIRTACGAPASGVACNEDDETHPDPLQRARAEGVVLGQGDIYVIVDSFSALTPGEYRLTFTWTPQQ